MAERARLSCKGNPMNISLRFGLAAGASLLACLLGPVCVQAAAPDGFATVAGNTTGGAGGPVVTVTTLARLQDYVSRKGPYVIQVSGTLEDPAPTAHGIRIASDKTVEGLAGRARIGNPAECLFRDGQFHQKPDAQFDLPQPDHDRQPGGQYLPAAHRPRLDRPLRLFRYAGRRGGYHARLPTMSQSPGADSITRTPSSQSSMPPGIITSFPC